ncbi:MAG: hypothetical protein GY847_17075 [Proteobacteria bacterium]|nr:hypothetical protein [Pseudomonadota bacterium]
MKDNTIRKAKLLIVEGNHERDFFKAWLQTLDKDDIQVMPIGGKDMLPANLRSLVKQSNFHTVLSLLIVRDADNNPDGAFKSVCSALSRVGLPVPQQVLTFIQGEACQVGVVIVPASNQPGALEDLLLSTVENDPMSPGANQFIEESVVILHRSGYRPPPPDHRRSKARIHAFLATFDKPDRDPGKAALAGVWDFGHKVLLPIQEMIQMM